MTTVADLLAEPHLALVAQVLPDPERRLRWVATSELEDPSPFLEGGELLLTTGLAATGWRAPQWRRYVDRLVAVGVPALGFGTGLSHRRVPAPLVRACTRAGVALLEVPEQTTFVAVGRAAARLLEEREQAGARDALAAQRALTRAAVQEDDARALLEELARTVRGAACLLAEDGTPSDGPYGAAADRLDLARVRAEVLRMRPQGLRATAGVVTDEQTTVVQPLGLRGRPTGYLAAMSPGRLTAAERGAVGTAVSLLSLAVQRRRDRRDDARRIRARAVELLLEGDLRTCRLLLDLADGRSAQGRLPARAHVVVAAGSDDLLDDGLGALEAADLVATRLRADELVWALCPASRLEEVTAGLAASGLLVGAGELLPPEGVAHGDRTARRALAQASATTPVVRWDRLVGAGPLGFLDPEQATLFATSYLAPLALAGDESVPTLRAYLRHLGSHGRVAAELGIHRNTVRNRVAVIEQALGASLDDPHTRAAAWLALQVAGGAPDRHDR